MIRTPDQAARYISEAPNEIERSRRQREVFAEQQSLLGLRLSLADGNGRLTEEGEQQLSAHLKAERAQAERAREAETQR